MCGIAGVLSRNGAPASDELIGGHDDGRSRTAGPTTRASCVDGPVGLGHRRLAIIDLSAAGHQPMANETASVVLIFNGEIYNFRELRARARGGSGTASARSTDTEVVLHAYEEWGAACLERFNGMFAFAIWDGRAARALPRPRPLRHQAALLRRRRARLRLRLGDQGAPQASARCRVDVEPAARCSSTSPSRTSSPTGRCSTASGCCRPAHCADDRAGRRAADPSATGTSTSSRSRTPSSSDEEYVEELDRLFRQAVDRQLVSDVPVGAYLSGGMDSGSITAVAAQSLPDLTTFTGGFDLTSASGLELGFDERRKRRGDVEPVQDRALRDRCCTPATWSGCMPELIWHLEDLRVGQCYPNYYVARLASKFVKVVLSGAGGDELFAGYPWRYYRASSTTTSTTTSRSTTASGSAWCRTDTSRSSSSRDVWATVEDCGTFDVFRSTLRRPRTPAGVARRTTSTTRSTSR